MTETWRSIAEWHGLYEVSDLGNVRSCDRVLMHGTNGWTRYKGRTLKPAKGKHGYLVVLLSDTYNGRSDLKYIHVLVLEAFVGPRPGKWVDGCHGSEGCLVNALRNLRWGTRSENQNDRRQQGTAYNQYGPWAKKG